MAKSGPTEPPKAPKAARPDGCRTCRGTGAVEVLVRYPGKVGTCYAVRCFCALGSHAFPAWCELGRLEDYHNQRGAIVFRWPDAKERMGLNVQP